MNTLATPAPAFWTTHRPWVLPVLALWGWQTGFLPLALLMGLVLEAPRLLAPRIDIAQEDFNRLWSFSTVLLLAVIFYLFLARQGFASISALATSDSTAQHDGAQRISDTALTFLRWLPFTLFPFTVAHAWCRNTTLPWSTFSLYEQARAKRHPTAPPPEWAITPMHPGYLYLGVVLFASTTAAEHATTFAPLLLLVLTWVLWPWRNRRYGVVAWVSLLSLLMTVAVLSRYSREVTSKAWELLDERINASSGADLGAALNPDQARRRTALGQVGAIQQLGGIILRVQTADGQPPGLLREATFNRFQRTTWDLPYQGFNPLDAQWMHSPTAMPAGGRELTVSCYGTAADVPLAVPDDLLAISANPPAGIEINDLAALRLRGGPPLIRYTVVSGPGGGLDAPPGAQDLSLRQLDAGELAVIESLAAQLKLASLPPAAALATLQKWFATGFTYSRWQEVRPPDQGPLAYFLLTSHAGHCEYYATATALLLRAAGIPTRYATGFSIEEQRGDQWLARGRDAHAWCLAWVDGAWQVVDNTPGTWRANEQAASTSWWEGISDAFSQAWFRFAAWRQDGGAWRIVVLVVGLAILAWIGWRQLRGSRWRRTSTAEGIAADAPIPGLDSEFFVVLAQLAARHEPRLPHETPAVWIRRLALPEAQPLMEAIHLHQRLRFDPQGLAPAERVRLRQLVNGLIAALAPATTR